MGSPVTWPLKIVIISVVVYLLSPMPAAYLMVRGGWMSPETHQAHHRFYRPIQRWRQQSRPVDRFYQPQLSWLVNTFGPMRPAPPRTGTDDSARTPGSD